MHNFERRGQVLHCEDASLVELAERFGTPLYVYSRATLTRHFEVFDEAFDGIDHLVCFAVKANPSMALLTLLGRLGAGADIVSGGELFRALRAGIPAERIVYSGVGKIAAEMEQALEAGILMFNIESLQELEALSRVAAAVGKTARIALRVNPDVDPQTHPYVATGLKHSKFGIEIDTAVEMYQRAAGLDGVEVLGVDCHIGSQLTELGPFTEAVERLLELVGALTDRGFAIRYLDLGGGLGITYDTEEPPLPAEYARAIRQVLDDRGPTLILEPGRNIAGNAGVLLTRVLYTKQADHKRFVIVDAGMNDLLRPSLYNAHHGLLPVVDEGRDEVTVDVVGPICESGDFLARERDLPELRPGELLAAMSAGAYGFSMASTYNSRPLAAEVLVDGDRAQLIRERGTYEDLIRGEIVPG
ncbi:MAG: diaminopimelate decarboxylase [Deltaproteobacteria bacterium]|nr:diaminopimelate decarboxylase [Deltaproteobacteria bacterium]